MPVNPPPYTNQWPGYHPSTHQGGCDNERNGLLPQPNYGSMPVSVQPKTSSSHTTTTFLGAAVLLLICLNIVTMYYPSMDRESIRQEWDAEQRRHQVLRHSWNAERNAMEVEREAWQKERVDRRLEREDLAAEKEQWRKEQAVRERREREDLATEKEKWRKEQAARERREHEDLAAEKEQWRKEQATREYREREDLAAEKEQWRQERADHENRERQEEEEKRALIVWQDLKPSSRCLRYGTREYSATLAHVPLGLDPLKECWNKSIDIHGRQALPSRCDIQGACGAVVGHWVVDFNEATCVTWWRGYDDKGCVEPGIHRYESVLENLQNGDDWHEMCATTPGHVQGRDFAGPTSCASWRSGINAIWLVEDGNCY